MLTRRGAAFGREEGTAATMDIADVFDALPSGVPESEHHRLIHELETSIDHLVRSNRELEEYMSEHGFEKDLRVAVGENIAVIARRRAVLEDLQKQVGVAAVRVPVQEQQPQAAAAGLPAAAPGEEGGVAAGCGGGGGEAQRDAATAMSGGEETTVDGIYL